MMRRIFFLHIAVSCLSAWFGRLSGAVACNLFCLCGLAFATEPKEPTSPADTDADKAVVNLSFEDPLDSISLVGNAQVRPDGPAANLFVGLPPTNHALAFTEAGAHLRIGDDHESGPLDFVNGDELTMEAWVRVERISKEANLYIIGKGRTYERGVAENQNYALRLRGQGQEAKVSFLFATRPDDQAAPVYHRWTSSKGFPADNIWHHVAISYRFGDPNSIQGFVDGESSKGAWDMGGATKDAPIHDNDSLWVGSSRGGEAANSLVGSVDDVRVYRKLVSAKTLQSRRKVVPQIPTWPSTADYAAVTVTLHAGAGSHAAFPLVPPAESMRLTLPKLALHRLPLRYEAGGVRKLWQGPVLLRAFTKANLPEGEIELLIRSPGLARLWLNGQIVAATPARRLSPDAHQPFIKYEVDIPWLRAPRSGDNEVRQRVTIQQSNNELILETQVGSNVTRCELGETLVAYRVGDQMFSLIGPDDETVLLVDEEFERYRDQMEHQLANLDRQQLIETSAQDEPYWARRHALAREYLSTHEPLTVPSIPAELPQFNAVDRFIHDSVNSGAVDSSVRERYLTPIPDADFLRRVSLDCIGVPPTAEEILAFEQEDAPNKRERAVTRLLQDPRWADHWTSYWQDVLAENPNILKPSLNNSGPFRLWIHDSLLLNKPIDRFVTELIRMQGDSLAGAAAGFAIAAENDVPMAEKAHIVASAFLAVDMKCARCHDAPYHPWKQSDLFHLGAMLSGKTIEVPPTSSVPKEFFDRKGRESPITLTLQPGDQLEPKWPFESFGPAEVDTELLPSTTNETVAATSREQVAALITRAQNERFPKVIANRVWTRLMGWGLVASVDDWEELTPRNADLLEYLGRELVQSGYDLKHLTQVIMLSHTYQRPSLDGSNEALKAIAFAAPWHRRLTAEQLVDSAHQVAGLPLETEAITFDPEASQRLENFLNLGPARKAWQLTSLSNERDRPSLALPKAAAVVECLEAFGWRSARPAPISHRETEANMVQPGVVANGSLTGWVTRFTDQSELTTDAIEVTSAEAFVERLFLRILNRHPTDDERQVFTATLREGFEDRVVEPRRSERMPPKHRGFATWSNHFSMEANALMQEVQREVAAGPAPTERLSDHWRSRAEDAAWALLNSPEFQFVP